mgnify:CR=1 FL=1
MQYTIPHYFKSFHCIGGKCPDTCCAGWQIQIDPASLKNTVKQKARWVHAFTMRLTGKKDVSANMRPLCLFK